VRVVRRVECLEAQIQAGAFAQPDELLTEGLQIMAFSQW
jgi:hypothetical protein